MKINLIVIPTILFLMALPSEAKIKKFICDNLKVSPDVASFSVGYSNNNGDAITLKGNITEGWEARTYKVERYDPSDFGELIPISGESEPVELPFIKIQDTKKGKFYKADLTKIEPLLLYRILTVNNVPTAPVVAIQ